MNVDEHFNQAVDMVKIGNGSFRKVNIFRLSRMAVSYTHLDVYKRQGAMKYLIRWKKCSETELFA